MPKPKYPALTTPHFRTRQWAPRRTVRFHKPSPVRKSLSMPGSFHRVAQDSIMTNEELLTGTYAAFNARNIDQVLAVMDPDVDWPNGMEGGRVRGQSAVRD